MKIKKIVKIVASSLTALIVLLVAYMLICNIVAVRKEKPVNYFGYSYSYVPTQSMEPVIHKGDTIIFKKCNYSSLKVGDIIVYKSLSGETKGMYIIHRIIGTTNDGLLMKGDNNPSADPEHITQDMLIGKYVRTFNFLNIGKLANKKTVIYGLLTLFFLGIIIMETFNIFLTKSKSKIKHDKDALRQEVLNEMKENLMKEILEEQDKESKK